MIILKSRNELVRGRETKTVSPNGIRNWNTTLNPQLTFRVLSHLLTLIRCNLLSLQRCFYVLLLQVSSYLVPVAQNPLDVAVAHLYVSVAQLPKLPRVAAAQRPKLPGVAAAQRPKLPGVAAAQLPPYATQPQTLPYVTEPQS